MTLFIGQRQMASSL